MPETIPISDEAVFRVGRVISVEGRTVRIRVDKAKNGSHLLYRGQALKNVAVGGHLKIAKGFSEIIATVEGEFTSEDRSVSAYSSKRDQLERVLSVSIVGFFDPSGHFMRGVNELPLVNNECFLLSHDEFERVHDFVSNDVGISIGTLPMEYDQPIRIGVNAFFASHIGIFGNTGSGKSYTLAKLYHEFLAKFESNNEFKKHARCVFIDFNGEYLDRSKDEGDASSTSVISANKTEYSLTTRTESETKIPLPFAELSDPGFWKVVLEATEKTQTPFLVRALRPDNYLLTKLATTEGARATIIELLLEVIRNARAPSDKADIDSFLGELSSILTDEARAEFDAFREDLRLNLDYHTTANAFTYRASPRPKYSDGDAEFFIAKINELKTIPLEFESSENLSSIRLRIILQYFYETFRGYTNSEFLAPLIRRLETRFVDITKVVEVSTNDLVTGPLTVISLKDVNLEMKKTLPLLVCKYLYKKRKAEGEHAGHLNLVIDEAHNILSRQSFRESDSWKDYRLETFEEIIKEGRKFSVFLTIASQRPHDISETIISQLHNYFLHRLVNEQDLAAIRAAVGYLDRLTFESLSILPTGVCILSGIGAPMSVQVAIGSLPNVNAPNNRTPRITDGWGVEADSVRAT